MPGISCNISNNNRSYAYFEGCIFRLDFVALFSQDGFSGNFFSRSCYDWKLNCTRTLYLVHYKSMRSHDFAVEENRLRKFGSCFIYLQYTGRWCKYKSRMLKVSVLGLLDNWEIHDLQEIFHNFRALNLLIYCRN